MPEQLVKCFLTVHEGILRFSLTYIYAVAYQTPVRLNLFSRFDQPFPSCSRYAGVACQLLHYGRWGIFNKIVMEDSLNWDISHTFLTDTYKPRPLGSVQLRTHDSNLPCQSVSWSVCRSFHPVTSWAAAPKGLMTYAFTQSKHERVTDGPTN